jgi:hypothetical protein
VASTWDSTTVLVRADDALSTCVCTQDAAEVRHLCTRTVHLALLECRCAEGRLRDAAQRPGTGRGQCHVWRTCAGSAPAAAAGAVQQRPGMHRRCSRITLHTSRCCTSMLNQSPDVTTGRAATGSAEPQVLLPRICAPGDVVQVRQSFRLCIEHGSMQMCLILRFSPCCAILLSISQRLRDVESTSMCASNTTS